MAVTKADLAWLACFIDSEGFIVMSTSNPSPQCGISNSDPDMLQNAQRILNLLHVKHSICKHNKVNRQVYQIRITDRVSLTKLFTKLMPYLMRVDKKAKLVLRYFALRDQRVGYNLKRTKAELSIASAVRAA